jgi:phage-related protein
MTPAISSTRYNAEDSLRTSSLPSIGKGVEEIRVWDESGTYRVIYTARLTEAVVVLDAIQKKTQATAKQYIEIAKERFVRWMRERR